jgi:aspartokinase
VFLLNHRGIPAKLADTRELIITDSNFGDAQPLDAVSKRILSRYLMRIKRLFW